MPRVISFAVVFFVFATSGLAADWALVIKPAEKQVPRLEVETAEGEKGTCSSILINREKGYLLTAAHCVDGKDLAITANGRHAEVVVSKHGPVINRILDLAILEFKVRGEQEMKLAAKSPEMGTEVAVVGYPFGIAKWASQFGHVAQTYNDETKTLWLNVDLIFGDSGGAVVNSHGELVGLSSAIYSAGGGMAHMAAAIPIEAILDFAEDYLPKTPKK